MRAANERDSMNSVDLNHLPTAVGRIKAIATKTCCSVDLNYLPTAVGRIYGDSKERLLECGP